MRRTWVHISLLRKWLDECIDGHETTCNIRDLARPQKKEFSIILIDVLLHRLVEAEIDWRYLSLSYVWGQVKQLRTTQANLHGLRKAGALYGHPRIPRVIQDAMKLTAALGERYLWVDTLCIIQDNPEHFNQQIGEMATIYHGATATIVAAAGKAADEELSELLPWSSLVSSGVRQQLMDHVSKIMGAKRPPYQLKDIIQSSTYNTRAWTFQERLLSRRCLFFTNKGVFFSCGVTVKNADDHPRYGSEQGIISIFEVPRDWGPGADSWDDVPTQLFGYYSNLVAEYTRMQLTFDSDIWDAFHGILVALQRRFDWKFSTALPSQFMKLALLWSLSSRNDMPPLRYLRRDTAHGPETPVWIPTWSWMGWKTPADYSTMPWPRTDPEFGDGQSWIAYRVKRCEQSQRLYLVFQTVGVDAGHYQFEDMPQRLFYIKKPAISSPDEAMPEPFRQPLIRIRDKKGLVCGVVYGFRQQWLNEYPEGSCKLIRLSFSPGCRELRTWVSYEVFPTSQEVDQAYSGHGDRCHNCITNVLLVQSKEDYMERLAIGQIHSAAFQGIEFNIRLA